MLASPDHDRTTALESLTVNKSIVTCPACDLRFLSARPKTYCPGCHQLVEPTPSLGA